jgi:hypothetical protein
MLKRLVLALPAVFCWGCASLGYTGGLSPQVSSVQIADENIVRQCQYLGDVTGAGNGTEYARADARNRAAAWGATHVVFVSETAYEAMARAYDCTIARSPLPAPPSQAPAQGDGGSSDHVAKVRAREQAAGTAADTPQP